MKKILILANHDKGLYNFRRELIEKLLSNQHEVVISSPSGEYTSYFEKLGCTFINAEFNRHGMNPVSEIKLINYYIKLMDEIKPDIVFGYTIKPNIYGAMAAKKYKIPFVANITGLGTAVENSGVLQKVLIRMYKNAFNKVQTIFFQNEENRRFFIDNNIAIDKHKMLPGSGVNLEYFTLQEYPTTVDSIEFVFVSRLMKEKGIEEYLEAASYISQKYPNCVFHVCGSLEQDYTKKIKDYEKRNIIKYHGRVSDVREIFKSTHCTIHPTYYPEGMSNVLLESAASGKPIITTNRSGTREIVNEGVNGYLIKEKSTKDLVEKIENFLHLPFEDKRNMGLQGRKKVEKEFDRRIVIGKYLQEIKIANKIKF